MLSARRYGSNVSHLYSGINDVITVGLISGFAAAYQLGADYPFNDDDE